jgi:CHAD domain-containing protein
MDAQVIESYWIQQHNICSESIGHYTRRANADDLHRLRVAIKKIKAVLTTLRDLHAIDRERFFAPYRDVFHRAGVVREATIIRDKLKVVSRDKKAVVHRTLHISLLTKKLTTDLPVCLKDMNDMMPEIITLIRSHDYTLKSYCHKQLRRLKRKWRKASADEDYHDQRRAIKLLLYSISLLRTADRKKIISAKRLKAMDKLQDLMGTWHDDIDVSAQSLDDIKDQTQVKDILHKEMRKLHKKMIKAGDKIWD